MRFKLSLLGFFGFDNYWGSLQSNLLMADLATTPEAYPKPKPSTRSPSTLNYLAISQDPSSNLYIFKYILKLILEAIELSYNEIIISEKNGM